MKLSHPSLFGEGEDQGGTLLPALRAGCGEAKGPWLCTGCKLPDAPSFSLLPNIFFFTLFQGQGCVVERILLTSSSPGG